MRMRTFFTGIVLAILALVPSFAFAQNQAPDPALKQLYLTELQLKSPDPSLDTRITAERTRIQKEELQQLTSLVNAADADTATTETPLQKEQRLVSTLETRRQETKVDHDLLVEDLSALQQNAVGAKGSVLTGIQRRQADAMSSSAVLEERLAAIDETLTQQQERLQRLTAQERTAQFQGLVGVALNLAIFLLIVFAERFVRNRLLGRIRDRNRRYFVTKIFTGLVYIVVIGWVLYHLSGDYPGFVTSFAIVGAGIAVALQGIIKDVVGWIIIMQKRLFTRGQRITIGPYTGDVADISLLRITLVEVFNSESQDVARTGQTLYLPNSMVIDQPVLNFHATSDFMEAELRVDVTHQSDWHKAEEILREILEEQVGEYVESARSQHALRTAHFFATQEPAGPRVFVELGDKGIRFILRFQIPIGQRRGIVTNITRKILERFAAADPPITLLEL